jgi:16S rRNA (adenine1518-N6/adenine1519-N6)-dimethyltransferase
LRRREKETFNIQHPTSNFELRTRNSELTLIHDDALEFLQREKRDWSGWKMVSNLPYSAASRIVVELAQAAHGPERLVVTLQLEVARRLMAKPGEPDYGLLTLLVQLNYSPKDFFKIPGSCFFPEPDVDSACITLIRRPRPLLEAAERGIFQKVVKRSFSQRRKMMLKLLKADWPAEKLERVFEQLELSRQTRAEDVSLEQFVKLAELLARPDQGKEPLINADNR